MADIWKRYGGLIVMATIVAVALILAIGFGREQIRYVILTPEIDYYIEVE